MPVIRMKKQRNKILKMEFLMLFSHLNVCCCFAVPVYYHFGEGFKACLESFGANRG